MIFDKGAKTIQWRKKVFSTINAGTTRNIRAKKRSWNSTSHHIQNLTPNRTSLAVRWLRLCASNAGVTGSIPGQRTKISYASQRGQKKKKKFKTDQKPTCKG